MRERSASGICIAYRTFSHRLYGVPTGNGFVCLLTYVGRFLALAIVMVVGEDEEWSLQRALDECEARKAERSVGCWEQPGAGR